MYFRIVAAILVGAEDGRHQGQELPFVGVMAVANALATVIPGTIAFTVLMYAGGMFTDKSAYARNVDAGGDGRGRPVARSPARP